MTVAVILAGGVGKRLGEKQPKQFVFIGKKRVIEWTVCAFEANSNIDEICIVCHKDFMEFMTEIVAKNRWQKVRHITSGGDERYESTFSGMKFYHSGDVLLFHDAARPFISQEIITNVAILLKKYNAVAVGIPSCDTIWQTDTACTMIQEVPQRARLFNAQTPQGFSYDTIREAYQNLLESKGKSDYFAPTDEVSIVKRYCKETPVHIVLGSTENLKITTQKDLKLCRFILARNR